MNYPGLTDADYDEKLREMGNYLWDLEQAADLASAEGRLERVEEIEAKILHQAERAHAFLQIAGNHQVLAAFVAGLGYRMTKCWLEATDHFLRVVQLSPMNGEAWLELTWCLAELGRWHSVSSRERVKQRKQCGTRSDSTHPILATGLLKSKFRPRNRAKHPRFARGVEETKREQVSRKPPRLPYRWHRSQGLFPPRTRKGVA